MERGTELRNRDELLRCLRDIHAAIRGRVMEECVKHADEYERLAGVADTAAGQDNQLVLDERLKPAIPRLFARLADNWSCALYGEAIRRVRTYPKGTKPEDAELHVLIDPIDGTRPLTYQKRSAWSLTGVAPGPRYRDDGGAPGKTRLDHIALAVQTELPILKQNQCDTLWAWAGGGAHGERADWTSGRVVKALRPRPTKSATIHEGYGSVARFCAGGRPELAAVDDDVARLVQGELVPKKPITLEDQYPSTGGQLYQLAMGHDRWVADLRPLVQETLKRRILRERDEGSLVIGCNAYDLCTELIAREATVQVTDGYGGRLRAAFDATEVSWIGYANPALRALVEPALRASLIIRNMLPGATLAPTPDPSTIA